MKTQGIVMENISLFDKDKDQTIGKLVRADKLITGKLEQFGNYTYITVDWIDLKTGYTEKTISDKMSNKEQLEGTLENIIFEIQKLLTPSGKIESVNGEIIKIHIQSLSDDWTPGAIFNLKKPGGDIYGKVKITKVEGNEAIGKTQTQTLLDFVKVDDIVEIFFEKETDEIKKCNVGLVQFISEIDNKTLDDIYLNCQTQINQSQRVNLFDDKTVNDVVFGNLSIELAYIIEGEIHRDISAPGCYNVTVRLKGFPTEQIVFQDYDKCVKNDLTKTVENLLHHVICYFPLQGKVIQVNTEEIWVNLGTNHNIKRKMEFVIKSKDGASIITQGKVDKVFRDYFSIKQKKEYQNVSIGSLIEMKEDKEVEFRMKRERGKIRQNYENHIASYKKAVQDSIDRVQKKIEEAKARLAPKSRLKISLGQIKFDKDYYSNTYGGKKTAKFNASLYLGNHPNFHFYLNYQYSYFDDNTVSGNVKNSFIAEQSGGFGARIQFVLPFLFSWNLMPFVEGTGKYCQFTPKLKPGSQINISDKKWLGYYLSADAGLELVFNRKFSLFAQAGFNRKIKNPEDKPKFEYLFIDGGIGIWF